MYILHKNSLLILFVALFFIACDEKKDTTKVISSNCNFLSLSISNDSFPNLVKTVFTADSLLDSISHEKIYTIVNKDSMDYGTSIDYVKINFRFFSSFKAILTYTDRTQLKPIVVDTILKGNEKFNLNDVFSIKNIANDTITSKRYNLKFNIHQVEPEEYRWYLKQKQISSQSITFQKAVLMNKSIYYLLSDGNNSYAYTIDTATYKMTPPVTTTGLPSNCTFHDLTAHNGQLYLTQGDANIYSSSDGTTWTKKMVNTFVFKSLIYRLDNKIWAVVQSADGKFRLANSADGTIWQERGELPSNYPVSDFTSLSYRTRNGSEKGIVIGGLDKNGNALRTNWNTENGYKLVNFASENSTLDSLDLGASIINYDSKLIIFGAIKNSTGELKNFYRESKDEGLSWKRIDTELNILRDADDITKVYEPRKYQSVMFVDSNDRIVIIGGKDNKNTYSDLWTGKLNRLYFRPIVK
jgi:hypothetical protein